MKCPKCQKSHKYKDGMRCSCGYQFVLDPKQDGITDNRFLTIVATASNNDTNYFTAGQLYTAYCRRIGRISWIGVIVLAIVLAIICAVLLANTRVAGWIFLILVVLAGFYAVTYWIYGDPPDRQKFKRQLENYQSGKGPLEKMLVAPQMQQPPPEWPEPDIYDYGVERLLIVQHDLLVDLLVRNNFHVENRTLVLSGVEYPAYLVEQAYRTLEENPQLPVFFLHDANAAGAAWYRDLQQATVLPWSDHPRIDLGLYPDDIRSLRRLRPLKPAKCGFALPVDALPYGVLESGLRGALEQQIPLSQLLAMREHEHAADATSFG